MPNPAQGPDHAAAHSSADTAPPGRFRAGRRPHDQCGVEPGQQGERGGAREQDAQRDRSGAGRDARPGRRRLHLPPDAFRSWCIP